MERGRRKGNAPNAWDVIVRNPQREVASPDVRLEPAPATAKDDEIRGRLRERGCDDRPPGRYAHRELPCAVASPRTTASPGSEYMPSGVCPPNAERGMTRKLRVLPLWVVT